MEKLAMSWYEGLKGSIKLNEPLSNHTTFKIGPNTDCWVEPYNLDDLKNLLKKAKTNKIKYIIIGSGSNLLIRNKKIPLVVHLGSSYFKKISVSGNTILAGAGASLRRLLNIARENKLGGMEFLTGIPATVGGALMMNAGVSWPKRLQIGDFVHCVEAVDSRGVVKILRKKDLKFGYRRSNLSKFIITKTSLKFSRKKPSCARKESDSYLDFRTKNQDLSCLSAGCIFKNPRNGSAGMLIDMCGLKGAQIGGAVVSDRHANFIVNKGSASAEDILKLIKLIQKRVRSKFKIDLVPEIKVV